jgi:LuxR family transcriptional regulator, maltose regulon positive regulatory protein
MTVDGIAPSHEASLTEGMSPMGNGTSGTTPRRVRGPQPARAARGSARVPSSGVIRDAAAAASRRQIPRRRQGEVERSRLLELLRSSSSPIVLVSAPGGYGKTILASQLSRSDSRAVMWLHLDADDNDPARLTRRLLDAASEFAPIPPDLVERLVSNAPRAADVMLPGLTAMRRNLGAFLLILDDVQLLHSDESVEVLTLLLGTIPDGSRLLLLTRSDPPIPLSQYRLDNDLLEIRGDQLALRVAETRLVAEAAGWRLDRAAAVELQRRTEGWPAGVALAAQAMRSSADGSAGLAGITGDRDVIADYLSEIAFSRMDDDRLRFLLATSVLDWMSGPLCDAALDAEGSTETLRHLARENLFIVPLDRRRARYRYHHLFREWLRAELERRGEPDTVATVLGRAAAWHEDQGDEAEAFKYACLIGDYVRAGRVALRAWDGYANRGQLQTMHLWLDRCTEAQIESDPQLSLAAAWIHLMSGEVVRARRYLAAASRGDLDQPSADGASSLRAAVANARSSDGADGVTAMLRDGEFVIAAESPRRTRWLLGGYRAVGIANVLLGRPAEAREALGEAIALSHPPALAYVRVVCEGFLALACVDAGDWKAARRWAREARRLVDARGLGNTLSAIVAYMAMATVKQHLGDAAGAEKELAEVDRVSPDAFVQWLGAEVGLRCGNVHLRIGNAGRAREFADMTREYLARYPDAGALPERLRRLERHLDGAGAMAFTAAEQRLLPYLPTHLSLAEIADRTGHARSTVKTQVASIYSKLDVTTRSGAVDRLNAMGLVMTGPAGGLQPA